MAKLPIVTAIEVHEFQFEVRNMTRSERGGRQYAPGKIMQTTNVALKIHTDSGIVGEYINSRILDAAAIRMLADLVIGESALEREKLYVDMKRAMVQMGRLEWD